MLCRKSVRVTYAHKRRRVQNASKKSLSSPLEVLPPEVGDLTRTQMACRMLKRSRRVALAEQSEDKNVEHIREHLAKRMKRAQERVSNVEPGVPLDMSPQDDIAFQTPFPSSQLAHESAVAKLLVPEQLSPVPVAKRIVSRTSSRNLKENSIRPQTLASPFCSRPGSAVSSPKHNGRGRPSRRVSRSSLHAKSRTLSGVFKENARRVSRKDSTVSLKDTNKEPPAKRTKHQRYPSSPPTSYMRSQFAREDWFAPPKTFSRTFDDYDEIPSPDGFAHSGASFYANRPQSCSTPAKSRLRKMSDLRVHQAGTHYFPTSLSLHKDSTEAGVLDVEMIDGTVPSRRQTIHLSGNSIFSSSGEFTIGSLAAMKSGRMTAERNNLSSQDEAPAHVARQTSTHHEAVDRPQASRSLAGSFIAEYDIPIVDLACSPASTAATKILGLVGIPKLSVGRKSIDLPGTSPAHGESLIIFSARNSGISTPPASPPKTTTCPPSPASDLALEFGSMDIHGDPGVHSNGEAHHPSSSIHLQARSRSLQGASTLPESTTNKAVVRWPARNRASTIRASDFAQPGVSSSGVVPGSTVSSFPYVRRTRSGTVVGPDSKLATQGVALPTRLVKGAPVTGLVAVPSGSDDESDDELLLKAAWIEDLEYLGLAVPRERKEAEADEMNLGGLWHGLESGPPCRLGLRRR